MSVNLDQLPDAITRQYDTLNWRYDRKTNEDIGECSRQHIVRLSDTVNLVTVAIRSSRDHLPAGIVDSTVRITVVSVVTIPENDKVNEVLRNYFQLHKRSDRKQGCYVSCYNIYEINGKRTSQL